MNIGIIFAGGVGSRMRSRALPKQFLKVQSKPIIVHTLEVFQQAECIDAIVIASVESGIEYLTELVDRYRLTKVRKIVPGGETGQLSIYNGLQAARSIGGADRDIVLIHDGVRPLINTDLLAANIQSVLECGSAITAAPAKETFVIADDEQGVASIPARAHSYIAKAPQSFFLKDILSYHERALAEGVRDSVDSCTLVSGYGMHVSLVEGPYENIKITTPDDFYMFKALMDARENEQIYGL
jgi:2-C-methyl-D-erythritol 4-phosphate cytidylyltransferase